MVDTITVILTVLFFTGALIAIISAIYHTFTGRYLFSSGTLSSRGYGNYSFNNDYFDSKIKTFLFIVAIALLSRLILFGLTALIAWISSDFSWAGNFTWLRWDANAYQRIAEFGYQTVGDAKYDIVFFPLYPFCIKLFNYIFNDYVLSAYVVSSIAFAFSTYFLYLLARIDFDEKTSYRVVLFYLIFPMSFFLMTAMSESLFMMFLFGGVYFARKKQWVLAGLFGMLCTLTRMPGIIVGAAIFIEMFHDSIMNHKNKGYNSSFYVNQSSKNLSKFIGLLLVVFGLFIYLYINYYVTGDWFKFLEYQKENWYNQAQFITKTLNTSLSNIISPEGKLIDILGIWVPNIAAFVLGTIALWHGAIKMRPSYNIFLIFYILVAYAPSWLLSGGRYMIAAFPIYFSFALSSKYKLVKILLSIICIAFLLLNSTLYFMRGALY